MAFRAPLTALIAAVAVSALPALSWADCSQLDASVVSACESLQRSLSAYELAAAGLLKDGASPADIEAARTARDKYLAEQSGFQEKWAPMERRYDELLRKRDAAKTPEERSALDEQAFQMRQAYSPLKIAQAEFSWKSQTFDPGVVKRLEAADHNDAGKAADAAKQLLGKPNPQNAEAARDLASGNPGAAVKALAPYVADHPNDAAAVSLLARAKLAQGDRAGALADARRALQLDPEDQEAKRLVSDLQNLAEAQRKVDGVKVDFGPVRNPLKGLAGDAVRTAALPVKRGLVVPGAGVNVPALGVVPPTLRSLFEQARGKFQINDDAGALMALHEAVDLAPNRTEAWDEIAEISNKDGDYEGAAAAADKALQINPDDARALRARAYAEFNLGDYRRALADAVRAVQLDPNNGLGYLYRAMAEEKLGDKAAAIRDYQTAARLDPALAPAALEGLARLETRAPKGFFSRPLLFRVGAVGGSGVLLLLGLLGTASGRRLAQEYTRRLKTIVSPAPAEPPRGPTAVSEFATVALGSVIGGHYRVTGELGRGGMGAVYRAQDETLNRPVAIKQLLRDGRGNPEDAARLLQEARLVARLQHPNIAEIYSVITENDLLLVFEFVDGESLDKTLRRNKKLPPARARQIMTGVCAALDYAHARGIIHRDLKPANVMIAADGAAKVMDFGIARQSRGGATLTKTMTASGTPPYMAPEQFLGSVSRASDLYSAAVMAYELLTGSRPFEGPDFVEPKLRKEFLPPSRLDAALPSVVDEFFVRALDPDPLKRPAGAVEFNRAFGAALAGAANPT